MALFWKAVAGLLLSLVLGLFLGQQEKALSTMLAMAACCMAAAAALSYLEPVLELLRELESIARLQGGTLGTLLKCVGIALVCELGSTLCKDGGFGSLAQSLQLLCGAGILYLSVPMIQGVMTLIQEILTYL